MDDERDGVRGPSLRVLPGGARQGERPRPGFAPRAVDEDTALLGAFLLGDDAAFGPLVRRHEDLVLRLVRRYARTPEDARDLAQRTFLRAFEAARRAFGHAAGDAFPFRRWLVRIALNLAKNHARDSGRWTRVPEAALDATAEVGGADAFERAAQAERIARVRAEVLRLPRRQREVLTLRLDGDLPFAEIAEALGITENAAKVNFHHATRRLRAALEEDAP